MYVFIHFLNSDKRTVHHGSCHVEQQWVFINQPHKSPSRNDTMEEKKSEIQSCSHAIWTHGAPSLALSGVSPFPRWKIQSHNSQPRAPSPSSALPSTAAGCVFGGATVKPLIYKVCLHLALKFAVGQADSISFSFFLWHRKKKWKTYNYIYFRHSYFKIQVQL